MRTRRFRRRRRLASEDEGVVSFAYMPCGGDGDDARDGAGVGDACAGVRVQR